MHHHIKSTITDHINLLAFSSKPHERDLAHYLQLLLEFYENSPEPYDIIEFVEEEISRNEDYHDFICFGYYQAHKSFYNLPLESRPCSICPALHSCQIATKLK